MTRIAEGTLLEAVKYKHPYYDSYRPTGAEIALARRRVRATGVYTDVKETAIVVWGAIVEASEGKQEVALLRKRDSYRGYRSDMPWEWWKVLSVKLVKRERRAHLRRLLEKHLPGLEIKPKYKNLGARLAGEHVMTELTFPRSAHDVVEEEVRCTEQRIKHERRCRMRREPTTTQWRSVHLYETLMSLPEDHPVRHDAEVLRASRKLRTYFRKNAELLRRVHAARGPSSGGSRMSAYSDEYAAYHAYRPNFVEGHVFHRAFVAAWRRQFPMITSPDDRW